MLREPAIGLSSEEVKLERRLSPALRQLQNADRHVNLTGMRSRLSAQVENHLTQPAASCRGEVSQKGEGGEFQAEGTRHGLKNKPRMLL